MLLTATSQTVVFRVRNILGAICTGFLAALESAIASALGTAPWVQQQRLPPFSEHAGSLISVGYCADGLASTRQHWVQMPETAVTIFDSSGNLPPNPGTGGPGRPMFSSTSGAAAKTSSVLSALTAYWKYPSLRKTENLTSKNASVMYRELR